MILKGNRRGGAKDLAAHLMKEENDHVQVHELRGFVAGDLMGALNETYAISKGTRCQKFMYSLSVNPPPGQTASTAAIVEAIEKAEKVLKLSGQPRAIVFHEKNGRRHAHAVWSLIDAAAMKAVRVRGDRMALQPLTRELFVRHGWKVPEGLLDRENRDPRSFTLKEYHQARKHGRDPRTAKAAIQTAWAVADSRAAFVSALEERGMKLARGDRADLVCVDMFGEVYSLPKVLGLRIKAVREKTGSERDNPERFLTVGEAKAKTAALMLSTLARFKGEIEESEDRKTEEFERRKADLVRRQRLERQ
ncbi:MAG: relaxase [Alphaproteobacteria bacterium]|nr:relaxase [Alphaproteobacteria bacterium]